MDELGVTVRGAGFLDWTVNGVLLRTMLGEPTPPHSTCMMVSWDLGQTIKWLDGLTEPDAGEFPDGRVAILVCSACGDLECGSLSTRVSMEDGVVRWSDFGWQVPSEEGHEPIEGFPSLEFAGADYSVLIASLKDRLKVSAVAVPATGHLWWKTRERTVIQL